MKKEVSPYTLIFPIFSRYCEHCGKQVNFEPMVESYGFSSKYYEQHTTYCDLCFEKNGSKMQNVKCYSILYRLFHRLHENKTQNVKIKKRGN